MPDNVTANPGSGGATFATDEISSVHHPLMKLEFGPDNTATMVEDATGKRLPVKVGEALPTGSNTIGNVGVTGSVSVTGPLTDAQLRASAVPVSGPLTDAQLRASAVPVSGPLTNTELRASAVTVDAGLRSDAVIVAGTALTPKFAAVNATITGNNTIVAAVSGKKLRVLSYMLVATNPSTARWQTGTSTALTGLMALCSNGVVSAGFSPTGHFETVASEALVLNATAGVTGHVTYVEV